MKLENMLEGRLIKRYKRFLADVVLDDGSLVVAHCTNSGSMRSCLEEGAEVWLSPADDPGRKTRFTWEMIRIGGDWVGINTSNPNALALEWVGLLQQATAGSANEKDAYTRKLIEEAIPSLVGSLASLLHEAELESERDRAHRRKRKYKKS